MNENQTSQLAIKPSLVCVGAVAGAFGVKGEVKIKPFTADPKACVAYGPLKNADGEIILTPLKSRFVKKAVAVTAKEIRTREQAEALKSTKLYVDRADLPDTEEDEFYYSDLIGMSVTGQDGGPIGRVKAVHNFGGGDMLEIQTHGQKDWFHPFIKQAVPHINLSDRTLTIEVIEPDIGDEDKAPKPAQTPKTKTAIKEPLQDSLYNTDILSLAATLENSELEAPHGTARKVSKLCGSWLEIDVHMSSGKVSKCALRVQACALGQASAAILKAHIIGASLDDLITARDTLRAMLKEHGKPPTGRFKDLNCLEGVKAYPARHTSTMLAFDAAVAAAEQALSNV